MCLMYTKKRTRTETRTAFNLDLPNPASTFLTLTDQNPPLAAVEIAVAAAAVAVTFVCMHAYLREQPPDDVSRSPFSQINDTQASERERINNHQYLFVSS